MNSPVQAVPTLILTKCAPIGKCGKLKRVCKPLGLIVLKGICVRKELISILSGAWQAQSSVERAEMLIDCMEKSKNM